MMKPYSKQLMAAAIGVALMPASVAVYAQDFTLEEIVVTAQIREQSLQDVPLSVSAVTGDKLADAGIEKIDDLVGYVPNIHMTESGLSTQLRIRGIGSDNNQGFEQSVGLYVDGVSYGRQQLIRAPFLDLERVEVLRGPQSILFGKNSISGALNMSTAKPTSELEGYITAVYEPEINQRELTAVVSGPITDNLSGRLAIRSYQEDGFIENTVLDRDEPNRDESAVRLSLAWDVSDDLHIDFKAEQDTFDVKGRQVEIIGSLPSTHPSFPGFKYGEIVTFLGQPGFEDVQDFKRQVDADEFSDSEVNNYTLTANYQMGENTLTLVSAWVDYEFHELCDCDFTSADVFTVGLNEEYEQFSQEIRLASPGGETVDWIAGFYYQTSELKYYEPFTTNPTSVLGPLLAGFGWQPGTVTKRDFNQDADALAGFAQATWNIQDDLRVTLGARYTTEEKSADRRLELFDWDGTRFPDGSFQPFIYGIVFGIDYTQTANGHDLVGDRDESKFTPLLNVQYDVNEDTMVYASYTTGFKAGGFDARANKIGSFEFEGEKTTAYEMGIKASLADGRGELNAAWYYTEYEDLQVSQFDGALGFNVGNAAETVVQGIELDGRWALSENLIVSFGGAYLDHEFTDFSNGNCYAGQTPDGDVVDGVGLCDYTGMSGVYSPKTTANVSFDYSRELGEGLALRAVLDSQYVGSHNIHPNLDPDLKIDAYTTMNLRVGLDAEAWSVAVMGKNLTDESILTHAADAPLSASSFQAKAYYGFLKRPRTVAVEASYRF